MFKGTYSFYRDGELLVKADNLITDEGKKQLLRYVAGVSNSFGEVISVGISDDPVTSSDRDLRFESFRAKVVLKSIDYNGNKIIFKCSLPSELDINIYEVGLWSSMDNILAGAYPSQMLATFDEIESWSGGEFINASARYGKTSLALSALTGSSSVAKLSNIFLDMSGYSNNDVIKLGWIKKDSNLNNIYIRFMSSVDDYFEEELSTTGNIGYRFSEFTKSSCAVVGNPTWDNINEIEVGITSGSGPSSVEFDAMRINDLDTFNEDYVMISRAVVNVNKEAGLPMDIEYSMRLI